MNLGLRLAIGGAPAIRFACAFVRAWPRALGLLLLACLLVQGTLIQTHIHFAPQRLSAPLAHATQAQAANPAKNDAADCPLCQEAAMAGAYLLPPAVALPPPPATLLWAATASIAEFRLLATAHSWQSRAPPQ